MAYTGSAAVTKAPRALACAVKLEAPPGQSNNRPCKSLSVSMNIASYSPKERKLIR